MTRRAALMLAFCLPCLPLAAQEVLVLDEFVRSMDTWTGINAVFAAADQALLQTDADEMMAYAHRAVRQTGLVMYSFDVVCLGGLEDGYGGFGLHILVDSPTWGRTWGNGNSYLVWFTFDRDAYGGDAMYMQVYRSTGPAHMDLIHPATAYPIRTGNLAALSTDALGRLTFTVNIIVDTATGELKVSNPRSPAEPVFTLNLGGPLASGSFVSLRTNSIAVSIDRFKVIALPK